MDKKEIGSILKRLRNASGLPTQEVIERLKQFDIDLSEKTLYGYENGLSSPQINTLFRLCEIYGVSDVSATFGIKTKTAAQPGDGLTDREREVALAYRAASDDDKAVVDAVLKKYIVPENENSPELAM